MRIHSLESLWSSCWKLLSLIVLCNTIILLKKFIFIMISFHLLVNIVFWILFLVWWCLCISDVLFVLSVIMSVLICSENLWIVFIQNCSLSSLLSKRNRFSFLSKLFVYEKFWINHRIILNKKSCVLLKSLLMIMMK